MKKTLVVAMALIAFQNSFGQKFLNQHVGKSYKSYEGVLAKLNPSENFLSNKFYTYRTKDRFDDNVAFPSKDYKFVSQKDSLINRIFRIVKTEKLGEDYYSQNYAMFYLVDTITQEKFYYVYDNETSVSHVLLTEPVKIIVDETELKSSIKKDFDEMENETHISTPFSAPVGLHKYIQNGKIVYYLDLSTSGSTLARGTGVTVLFSDGTKWVKNVKIDINYSDGWRYSSWITLSTADLQLFKTKSIKKFRLYIYDKDVEPYEAEEFKKYVSLITLMK